ncbi:ABC transporter ATP-binding protein [Malaciobacter mytili LMG 24559]|uniref:ABC transporter ATP-binding protein n=1 Tax=Malaciobacter mytili LMG 24559 TaxID=1032238 RepID=A0AAX2AL40_9BACT|nr:ATP-binding cassette domain-containing protein [Malaciobacter mytili]AXH15845.1 ABC transporter, ATP-binding protein [Malaciobacter mytili LMG 24559]RXK16411.1 ABC transporter ATP-binding protein [Malaciobacter mytili LMG 24559]
MLKIEVKELNISHQNKQLVDISFNIENTTALIGESGSGKSLTLKALLNLLPSELNVKLNLKSQFELDVSNIGFIPQNPFTSLSPMTKIKNQFFCDKEKKKELLNLVGLEEWVLNRFPIQLSGGQLQRVVIAMVLSKKIKLLLLDEPTTALDEKSKIKIIELIKQITSKLQIPILFVTHDIESIKTICENLIIIKKGKVIEKGKTLELIKNPKNDYTKVLIDSNFKNREFRK